MVINLNVLRFTVQEPDDLLSIYHSPVKEPKVLLYAVSIVS
jgi:hypothetical protein